MKTSEVLKQLMMERKLSARQLARDTKLSQSTISDILAGRQPTVKSLQVLAKFFNQTLDYMVYGSSSTTIDIQAMEFETMFNDVVRLKIERLKK